jgi:polyisoprenoid-binding protein YceI
MNTKTWNIDTSHSGINFSVRHMVVSKVRGRFAKFAGVIDLNEDDLTHSTLEATIDAASIDTGTPERDAHLRSADFFDAEAFPTLRYRSRRIEALSGDRYRVIGDLTIRDVTREVPLEVEYGGRAVDPWGNERAGFSARASLERKEFGLAWNQVLEAGGVLVGERVDIDIELEVVSAAAERAA